ncbi:hypothetical protein MPL3365_170317 [Mesorhizobium plurifarium]|uniref:Uncharacterized protein n=1 Tax=Mesorhizobium plurifarium TaxID=69974 RepID=A0A090G666_MESPL|nr:hypothetical protein MPL3365_170317 [Mesorhizobium plurifarium]
MPVSVVKGIRPTRYRARPGARKNGEPPMFRLAPEYGSGTVDRRALDPRDINPQRGWDLSNQSI